MSNRGHREEAVYPVYRDVFSFSTILVQIISIIFYTLPVFSYVVCGGISWLALFWGHMRNSSQKIGDKLNMQLPFPSKDRSTFGKCADRMQDTGEEHRQSLYNSNPTGAGASTPPKFWGYVKCVSIVIVTVITLLHQLLLASFFGCVAHW